MWTAENGKRYDRSQLRYPNDLTNGECSLIEPLIAPAKRGGRRHDANVQEVMNGIMSRVVRRLPVAGDSEGSAAQQHGVCLPRSLDIRRHAGAHSSRALDEKLRASEPGSEPYGRHRRS